MGKKSHLPTIHDPRYRTLMKELVAMRLAAGLKQEDMGEILGLSQPDISKIERFERRLDALEFLDWLSATRGKFERLIRKL